MTGLFFALLRSGLHERPLAADELLLARKATEPQWQDILSYGRKQAVPGLLYQALLQFPADLKLPDAVVTALMSDALHAARHSYAVSAVSEAVTEKLRCAGLSPVVMKGTTVAAFYRHPEFRVSGDVDLYLPAAELPAAHALLDERSVAPDGTLHGRFRGVDIDLHDRYFDLHCAPAALPPVGSPEATLLMLSSHILKHAIGPGVGMRQLCDMAMAWQALGGKCDPDALKALFRRTGTLRWNRLLFAFLRTVLDVPSPLFADERAESGPLLKIVLEGGNFGHYTAARSDALSAACSGEAAGIRRRKRNTLTRFLRRLPFSLRYAPRETFATMWTLVRRNLQSDSSQARGTAVRAKSESSSETTT